MLDYRSNIVTINEMANNEANNRIHAGTYKIILLGDVRVGKTAIVKRFINNTFEDIYFKTILVDFYEKEIIYDNQSYRLHIWDVSGDNRFNIDKHKTCYKNAQCCIIVFDLTNTFSFVSLDLWICEILHHHLNSYIIIVGNKMDYEDDVEITDEMIHKYLEHKNIKYFYTSAKYGTNIEQLFLHAFKLVHDQPMQIINLHDVDHTARVESNPPEVPLLSHRLPTYIIDSFNSSYKTMSNMSTITEVTSWFKFNK